MQRLAEFWKNRVNPDDTALAEGRVARDGGYRWMVAGVLGLAVLLRLAQYLACRSLWLDEASMAWNFFEPGFGKLLQPFPNHQPAPIGFNALSELMVRIAGLSEWALRFFPFLIGLAAVFAFWRMSRRWLSGMPLVFVNYAFAISSSVIYYSNEFKPYIVDVFLGIALGYGTLAWWEAGRPRKGLLWLALGGCAAVWFSFPIVFVLAGVGTVVLIACLWQRRFRELWGLGAVVAAWLLSFGAQYLLFARHIAAMDDLGDYWRGTGGFMPFPPWRGPTWFTGTFFNYFDEVAGLHHSRNILQFIFLCGLVELWRSGAFVRLGVLLGPIVVTALVSATERYPFQGRLVLFTVPFALLICGEGMKTLLERLRQPLLCLALIGIALFSPSAYSLPLLWRPAKVEEVRPLAEFLLREAGAEDLVFVFKDNSSFAFYKRHLGLKQTAIPIGRFEIAAGASRVAQELEQGRRCWLFISHATDEERAAVLAQIQAVAQVRSAKEEVGAQLFMIEPLARGQ